MYTFIWVYAYVGVCVWMEDWEMEKDKENETEEVKNCGKRNTIGARKIISFDQRK